MYQNAKSRDLIDIILMLRIKSNYFTASLDIENGKVVGSVPIIHYMLDWSVEKVRDYAKKKKWKVEEIETGTVRD